MRLGSQSLRRRLEDPSLPATERAFLDVLRPVLERPVAEEQRVFVGGAASLLDDAPAPTSCGRTAACSSCSSAGRRCSTSSRPRSTRGGPFVRVGDELGNPALQELALVGSTYGLTTRTLGTVSLLGPLRMDYEQAIRSVRSAASELSRLSESVYDED